MSGLVSIDTVYVAIFFLVPGYIFLTFRNQFVAGQDRLGTEQHLRIPGNANCTFPRYSKSQTKAHGAERKKAYL